MKTGEIFSALGVAFAQEEEFISSADIPAEDRENGLKILSALQKSVKDGCVENIDALLCGYSYFVLNLKCVSDGIAELIELIEAYEKTI